MQACLPFAIGLCAIITSKNGMKDWYAWQLPEGDPASQRKAQLDMATLVRNQQRQAAVQVHAKPADKQHTPVEGPPVRAQCENRLLEAQNENQQRYVSGSNQSLVPLFRPPDFKTQQKQIDAGMDAQERKVPADTSPVGVPRPYIDTGSISTAKLSAISNWQLLPAK